MKIILIGFVGIFLLITLNIIIGIYVSLHFRKCPYCGKRMKHMKDKLDKDGEVEEYVFHCENCGAWQHVAPVEMLREQDD